MISKWDDFQRFAHDTWLKLVNRRITISTLIYSLVVPFFRNHYFIP